MTDPFRLPRSVAPQRYDLRLALDPDADGFGGEQTITLRVEEPVRVVVLHADGLTVEEAWVEGPDGPQPATVEPDPATETLALHLAEAVPPGTVRLGLRFAGRLAEGLVGLYRSTFIADDGQERRIAATQFEAPHARKAFPCFDEPDLKAVFSITLDVPDGLVALSNGEEVGREPLGEGRCRVRFADTMPMSTYLVAFVVGPLAASDPLDVDGVPLRVVHVPGREHLTDFALEVGAHSLRWFAQYYGIAYPAAKLDLVALPDFAFGAMENLGCVTFRETALLLDVERATYKERARVALVVAHEIAHMWFGDLVTMKWWNGIWLNEAFATFMETACVDAFRPDWGVWSDFTVGRSAALTVDSLSTTRAVEYEVRTPEDADGMFDVLTYEKGGSVLRMLERYLGEDAFRSGVRLYLDRHRYANTETTDLWDALEAATGHPTRRIMDSWIFQPGYPLVALEAHDSETSVTLHQERAAFGVAGDDARWSIPVLLRAGAGGTVSEHRVLLEEAAARLDLDAAPDWVAVNAGGHGFYRVAMPAAMRSRLLTSGALDPVERFTLVDDLWFGVLAGREPAGDFLALAEHLRDDPALVVWQALVPRLRELSRFVAGDDLAAFRARVRALLGPAVARHGWAPQPGEDLRDRELRGVLLDALGTLGRDPETIARARETHGANLADPAAVDPEVAAAATAIVAADGTDEEWDRFAARRREAPTPQEQLRYTHALGAFPGEEAARRTLDLAFSGDVRSQDAPLLLRLLLLDRDHGPLAWATVRDRWDEVTGRFQPTLVTRMLEGVVWLVDDHSLTDVTEFLGAHPLPEGDKTIRQHLERQAVHAAAVHREGPDLAAALRAP